MSAQLEQSLNNKHRLQPEIGDYWHEMGNPTLVVLNVDGLAQAPIQRIS